MTKKIKWRLKDLPTISELRDLVESGILNKDEAREMLFTREDEDTNEIKALKEQIKFLEAVLEAVKSSKQPTITFPVYYPTLWYWPTGTPTWISSTTTSAAKGGTPTAYYVNTSAIGSVDAPK